MTETTTAPLETEHDSFALAHQGIWSQRAGTLTVVPILVFQALFLAFDLLESVPRDTQKLLMPVGMGVAAAIGFAAHVWTRRRDVALVLIRPSLVVLPRLQRRSSRARLPTRKSSRSSAATRARATFC